MRRFLIVGSGHAWSTIDVQRGLLAGFVAAGYEAFAYDLHTRLRAAQGWVEYANRVVVPSTGQAAPPDDWEPTPEDIVYQAGVGAIIEALRLGVDAVVMVCGLLVDPRILVMMRRAGLPVFMFGTESPYDDEQFGVVAGLSTAASVNEPASVETVRAGLDVNGIEGARGDVPISYLPLGYDPTLHRPGFGKDASLPAHDVVFVGNLYPSRQAFLEAIDWAGLGIDLGLYGVTATVGEHDPIRRYVCHDGPVPNPVAAGLYTRAAIVLNLFRTEQFGHEWAIIRDDVRAEAISPRLIEAAALGCFTVSEDRAQVHEVFGDAVPTFREPAEAAAMIRRFLDDDLGRRSIEAHLPRLVASYSYAERARQIVERLTAAVAADPLRRAA